MELAPSWLSRDVRDHGDYWRVSGPTAGVLSTAGGGTRPGSVRWHDVRVLGELHRRGHVIQNELAEFINAHRLRLDT
jgi:hypothetical protein